MPQEMREGGVARPQGIGVPVPVWREIRAWRQARRFTGLGVVQQRIAFRIQCRTLRVPPRQEIGVRRPVLATPVAAVMRQRVHARRHHVRVALGVPLRVEQATAGNPANSVGIALQRAILV